MAKTLPYLDICTKRGRFLVNSDLSMQNTSNQSTIAAQSILSSLSNLQVDETTVRELGFFLNSVAS